MYFCTMFCKELIDWFVGSSVGSQSFKEYNYSIGLSTFLLHICICILCFNGFAKGGVPLTEQKWLPSNFGKNCRNQVR